jgi:NitT/TauT family transport system permease protein
MIASAKKPLHQEELRIRLMTGSVRTVKWLHYPRMAAKASSVLLPIVVFAAGLVLWAAVWELGLFHKSALPSPAAVVLALGEELRTGRMINDLSTSLFRVTVGFLIALIAGIPMGLWMGHQLLPRAAFLPILNFFRNLSPLAWMPFAILWFGVGDTAAIFLIFISAFFPVVLATMAAMANIPSVYFRVADTYGLRGTEKLLQVTLPAIMPQLITMLRVTAGLCWLVVVAAEMIAGRDGLGFAVMDSRNGLRMDLLVAEMIVIGIIGVLLDRVLVQLTRIPSVRWGYER